MKKYSMTASIALALVGQAFGQGVPVESIAVTVTSDSDPSDGIDAAVDLDSISIIRAGAEQTYLISELVGIEVTALERPEFPYDPDAEEPNPIPDDIIILRSAAQPLSTVTGGNSQAAPDPGMRTIFLTDNDVVTAFRNWTSITVGFTAPVTNGPGPDVVLFELSSTGALNANDDRAFTVSANSSSINISPSDYRDLGLVYNVSFHVAGGFFDMFLNQDIVPPTNLTELETMPLTSTFVPSPLVGSSTSLVHGVAFDLSDLGYAPDQVVNDLELVFTSGDPGNPIFLGTGEPAGPVFDPSFIAALPPNVTTNPCDFNTDGFIDWFDVKDILAAAQNNDPAVDVVSPAGVDALDVETLVAPIRDQMCN